MKFAASLLLFALGLTSCGVLNTYKKTLGPSLFGVAPATATVPDDFPVVRRLALIRATGATTPLGSSDAGTAAGVLSIENKLRETFTARGFSIIDRREAEVMMDELNGVQDASTEDAYFSSLAADAVLFWDCTFADPHTNRTETARTSTDVRCDLVLKCVGRIRGEASASSEGRAGSAGSRIDMSRVSELMNTCARSAGKKLAAALPNPRAGD